MVKILIAVAAALVLAVGASGVLVGVADAAAPGDALYGLDRAVENLRLNLAAGPEARLRLQQEYTLERLMEIQTLTASGEKEHLGQALRELSQSLVETSRAANNAGAQAQEVNELLQETFQKAQGKEKNKEPKPKKTPPASEKTETNEQAAYCGGVQSDRHPVGDKLAERYNTTYEAIMAWFCQGYGFGEVELAYRISREAGVSIETVFAQKEGGMGWGEIMQFYKMIGKDKPPKEKNKP